MKMSELITTASRSWTAPCLTGTALMGAVLLSGPSSAAEARASKGGVTASNAIPTHLTVPQSVFDADLPTGRDPFFPNSKRRAVPDSGTSETPSEARFPDQVRLSGVSGTPDSRLAIINHRTFAVGETNLIRAGGRSFAVRVEAIKETSAVITINGITREIHLREGL
jgi:hypothetical protein